MKAKRVLGHGLPAMRAVWAAGNGAITVSLEQNMHKSATYLCERMLPTYLCSMLCAVDVCVELPRCHLCSVEEGRSFQVSHRPPTLT